MVICNVFFTNWFVSLSPVVSSFLSRCFLRQHWFPSRLIWLFLTLLCRAFCTQNKNLYVFRLCERKRKGSNLQEIVQSAAKRNRSIQSALELAERVDIRNIIPYEFQREFSPNKNIEGRSLFFATCSLLKHAISPILNLVTNLLTLVLKYRWIRKSAF